MKLWLGVTDNAWFDFLSMRQPDEVNFWQPSGKAAFRALDPGELFLFKLKSPRNAIGGGGFFVRHLILPLSIAWSAFGEKNGTGTYQALREKIEHYRTSQERIEPDPKIGCIILTEPFFFQTWIPQPDKWGKSIVQGKTYSLTEPDGKYIYEQVQRNLNFDVQDAIMEIEDIVKLNVEPRANYRLDQHKFRLGQGSFRALVTEVYHRRCAVTGERTLPVLNASHIKPYSKSGPHDVRNGILLRSDIHTLFDLGYMTLATDYHIEVSRRIKDEYENGRDYYSLHGRQIALPSREVQYPDPEYIEWHNLNIFRP